MTNYLIYEPAFAKDYGPNATILLSLFLFKYKYWYEEGKLANDGSFFISTKDIEALTGLKRRKRESGTKTLIDGGFIEVLSENGETFRLKVNINHVQNVHALIETMYKTYMLPCTKRTYTINKTNNQSRSNQKSTPVSSLEEEKKKIYSDPDSATYKSVIAPRSWFRACRDKWGEELTYKKVDILDKYLTKYPDQRKWILGRDLNAFINGLNEAYRVLNYTEEDKPVEV